MSTHTRLKLLRAALTRLRDEESPPVDLLQAALALHRPEPVNDVFYLLAAASSHGLQALACTSASGLWTLEVFEGQSPEDKLKRRGQILLSVHPDNAAGCEGRIARVSVSTPDGEQVIAEAPVRGGQMLAEISLAGLDLTSHAINLVFGEVRAP